jgi:hypothetical protein
MYDETISKALAQVGPEEPIHLDLNGPTPIGSGGVYLVAFDVTGAINGPKGQPGRKTTKGAIYASGFGTTKLTAFKKDAKGPWINIAYDQLEEAYGEPVSGLFLAISDDYNDFWTQVWEGLQEFSDDMGIENSPCQVWVKIKIPDQRGSIVRQDYTARGQSKPTAQYKHRAMIVDKPVFLPLTDPRICKSLNEEGVIFDTTEYLSDLPTRTADVLRIGAKNVASMAVLSAKSREMREAASGLREDAKKAARKRLQASASQTTPSGGSQTVHIPTPLLPDDNDE